jgi:hypothetical protein
MKSLAEGRQRGNGILVAVVASVLVLSMRDSSTAVTAYLQQQQQQVVVATEEAATDVSPAAVASLSYYCSYDTCQCSADLRELTCRGVYFTRVPAPLPTTLVKL